MLRPVRLNRRERMYCHAILSLAGEAENVLDVGGGTGMIASCLMQKAKRVVVLDPSEEMLSDVPNGVDKVKGYAQDIPFPDSSFDLALCVDSLHHFPNDFEGSKHKAVHYALTEIFRVLRPHGSLVIIDFDTGTLAGKLMSLFEITMSGKDDLFYSKAGLEGLLRTYVADVEVSRLGWMSYIAKAAKKPGIYRMTDIFINQHSK